ncbi:hypothetical protein J6590_049683 [Homalodisca vitripennis]|nr:hypothetical protein J6590_049683 [Homalodisca vitripennis]
MDMSVKIFNNYLKGRHQTVYVNGRSPQTVRSYMVWSRLILEPNLSYLPPTSPPTQNTGFRSVAVFRSSDLHCVLKTCRSLIPYSSDNAQIVYGLTDRWFVTRHN